MNKILLPVALLLSAVMLCTSCLGSDDDDTTYYDDTAITAFSLGTLNQYLHTTSSSGGDSIYTTTVTGSNYSFYIDQQACEIYNPDSLPVGTDAEHVICSISAKNSGTIVLKNIDSDTLTYYSSSDSIDFTSPRTVYVYALSGAGRREYTIHVNVHQEEADSFQWKQLGSATQLASLQAMKAVSNGGNLYVFGKQDGQTVAYTSEETDGKMWRTVTSNVSSPFSAEAYATVVQGNGYIYLVSDGVMYRSTNATDWTQTGYAADISQLVGVGKEKIYALNTAGQLVASKDEGSSWTEETINASTAQLPSSDVNCCILPLQTNADAERVVIAGNRSVDDYPADTTAVVWGKVEEFDPNAGVQAWMYYDVNEYQSNLLPRLTNLQVFYYNDGLLAFGGTGKGACQESAFSQFYFSQDGGLTWMTSDLFPMPDDFSSSGSCFAATVDSGNNLWIIGGETGEIWRGRLNKLGWVSSETSFSK